MSFELNDYTVLVYKADRRSKAGERLVLDKDHTKANKQNLEHLYRTTYLANDGYRIEVRETYREVTNAMTGETVKERYDKPYSCSVASEAYWSA